MDKELNKNKLENKNARRKLEALGAGRVEIAYESDEEEEALNNLNIPHNPDTAAKKRPKPTLMHLRDDIEYACLNKTSNHPLKFVTSTIYDNSLFFRLFVIWG